MKAAIPAFLVLAAFAAPATASDADPATLLNRAAALAEQGDYAEARAIYRQVAATPADFKLETSNGSWAYPAEIARRGLLAIERRSERVEFASSK